MPKRNKKIKILIAGIGGVGGFFGGLLAKEYLESDAVEIYFLARGKHLVEIKKNGLLVKQGENTFIANPTLATENVEEIGIVDYIILCTKTYDLEEICQQLKPCFSKETIILPLLNGVNNTDVIRKCLPDNLVVMGCVYIVANRVKPGQIENTGNIQSLYFGLDNDEDERVALLESLFKKANIESTLTSSISTVVWEKYIFLSSIATATSYFDSTIGEILENNEKYSVLKELVKEVTEVALLKKIIIDDNIIDKTFKKFNSLPAHITSSLHRDFQNQNSKTELDSLTGYVVNEAAKIILETPLFKTMYLELKNKEKNL